MLLPALVLGSVLAAQGAGKIVLTPGIDTPGVVSEVTDLRIAADKAAELARLAPRVSTRLYAGRKAHVFHTSFAQAAWLGMHVKRVSVRDSGLLVRVGGQEREAVWPARAERAVDETFFVPIPPGSQKTTVLASAGTVVITEYAFYTDPLRIDVPRMTLLQEGRGHRWAARPRQSSPAEGARMDIAIPTFRQSGGAAFGWPKNWSPHDSGMVVEDVWPTVFFGAERLAEVKRKIASLAWAKEAFEQMRREAAQVLAAPPMVPIERPGSRHAFYSIRSAEHLIYDPASPHAALDPWSGRYESSQAQHRAWVLLTHERTHRVMRSLGFLYGLSGDERCAAWVAEAMRREAEMFRTDELRENSSDQAIFAYALYDAQALLGLASAYSLTRHSKAYTDADHQAIRKHIFEDGMHSQFSFLKRAGVHNMTCYVSAALGTVGHLLGRQEWIDRAIDDKRTGLRTLLLGGAPATRDGTVDGLWVEGSMFYHYYSLCPLITLFELEKALRGKLSKDPEVVRRFRAMFEGPMMLADQQLRLPALGDLGAPRVMSLVPYRHVYEYAAGQLGAKRFGPTLAALYAAGPPRNSLTALAFGPDELPAPARPLSKPTLLERAGIGVFRSGECGGMYLLFRAGRHGGGHDHPDKLQIALNALGEVVSPDLGRSGETVRECVEWVCSTFAHNTLVVDEHNQGRVTRATLDWRPRRKVPYARGTISGAYPNVALAREVFFDPPYVVIADRCSSDGPHRYGWLYHAYGSMNATVSRTIGGLGLPRLPAGGPLRHFTARRTSTTDGVLCADWRVRQRVWLRLLARSDAPFQATVGRSPGQPLADGQGMVYLRARGKTRRFFAVLEVHRGAPSAVGLTLTGSGAIELRLASGKTRRYAR